jgi:hypothetical protein
MSAIVGSECAGSAHRVRRAAAAPCRSWLLPPRAATTAPRTCFHGGGGAVFLRSSFAPARAHTHDRRSLRFPLQLASPPTHTTQPFSLVPVTRLWRTTWHSLSCAAGMTKTACSSGSAKLCNALAPLAYGS